jgi:hypothetical protein
LFDRFTQYIKLRDAYEVLYEAINEKRVSTHVSARIVSYLHAVTNFLGVLR